jgi:tetratricopeptide (TPR) repeat protein
VAKTLLLILVLLSSSGWARGQEGRPRIIDEKLQMDLADNFFQEGDYYRAVTEYKAFLFFFPQSPRAEEALWKIASSYFQGGRWDGAISAAEDLLKRFPSSSWAPDALLLMGRCFAEKKDYSQARTFFRQAQEIAPGKPSAAEAQFQIARTYVFEERWKEAVTEFGKVDPASKLHPKAEIYARGLERVDELPRKSPAGAGVLAAVLPGAGHLYCERYRDAAIAFALNGAFIWGMVEAFEDKNYVVGGILTFFELGWYSGNIYSAVSGAHKYNRSRIREYLDRLEKEGSFSAGIFFRGKYPVFALRYDF